MTRTILGMAAILGWVCAGSQSANAQVIYSYGAPPTVVYAPATVYSGQVYVESSPVVTSAYYAPAPVYLAPAPVVQMSYSTPVLVSRRTVIAAPVVPVPVVVGPNVRETTRVTPHNYIQTVRAYGPTPGPHYHRIHIHRGLFGTTVRERVR